MKLIPKLVLATFALTLLMSAVACKEDPSSKVPPAETKQDPKDEKIGEVK